MATCKECAYYYAYTEKHKEIVTDGIAIGTDMVEEYKEMCAAYPKPERINTRVHIACSMFKFKMEAEDEDHD